MPSNRFCLIFLRSQVDLYIQNKQLIKDNLKLQESLDDLNETLQQAKNKEEKAANEQINSFQRKVRFRFSFCSPKNLTIPLTSCGPEVLAYRFWPESDRGASRALELEALSELAGAQTLIRSVFGGLINELVIANKARDLAEI